MTLMLGTSLRILRLRLRLGRILRTLVLAACMTAAMALTAFLGLIPAGAIGVLVYLGGLFALRIVNLQELRALRRPAEIAPDPASVS
jgi:hypothetical protein